MGAIEDRISQHHEYNEGNFEEIFRRLCNLDDRVKAMELWQLGICVVIACKRAERREGE